MFSTTFGVGEVVTVGKTLVYSAAIGAVVGVTLSQLTVFVCRRSERLAAANRQYAARARIGRLVCGDGGGGGGGGGGRRRSTIDDDRRGNVSRGAQPKLAACAALGVSMCVSFGETMPSGVHYAYMGGRLLLVERVGLSPGAGGARPSPASRR